MKVTSLGDVRLEPNFLNTLALVPSLNLAASNFAADCFNIWFISETSLE